MSGLLGTVARLLGWSYVAGMYLIPAAAGSMACHALLVSDGRDRIVFVMGAVAFYLAGLFMLFSAINSLLRTRLKQELDRAYDEGFGACDEQGRRPLLVYALGEDPGELDTLQLVLEEQTRLIKRAKQIRALGAVTSNVAAVERARNDLPCMATDVRGRDE